MAGIRGSLSKLHKLRSLFQRKITAAALQVSAQVVSEPVEKEVHLRDEHVRVERRQVDRPATASDLANQGRVIEATERHEEAVVEKRPRVVEEVVVKKEVAETPTTVRESVKRTEVELEDDRDQSSTPASRRSS